MVFRSAILYNDKNTYIPYFIKINVSIWIFLFPYVANTAADLQLMSTTIEEMLTKLFLLQTIGNQQENNSILKIILKNSFKAIIIKIKFSIINFHFNQTLEAF